MGLILEALKQAFKEEGADVQFLNTGTRVLSTEAQAKYSDVRRVERDYTHGVSKARKAAVGVGSATRKKTTKEI